MSDVRKFEKGYKGRLTPGTIKWMEDRSEAFGNATSSKKGKPPDGVTYGKGQKREEKS